MILQALDQLYQRLTEDPSQNLPPRGYSMQNISFRVVLDLKGGLIRIQNTKENDRAISIQVPGQTKPPGIGINPCFLWDTASYMLGVKADDPAPERTQATFQAFRAKHLELESAVNSPEFSAVCRFLEGWQPEMAPAHPELGEVGNGFGIFQISGQTRYVHEVPEVKAWWDREAGKLASTAIGMCLVRGTLDTPLAQLHEPAVKGVAGGQPGGGKLVSFQMRASESYKKEQGMNAPVSEDAAFAYCNALNWLLSQGGRRFRLGDATTVFWTETPAPAEEVVPWMMSGFPQPADDALSKRVRAVLENISKGILGRDELGDADARYYILGLSPNAARLSVRFWHTGNLGELGEHLRDHLCNLRIVRQWDESNSKKPEPLVLTAFQILRQTAREADGIPPLLSGAFMRSILLGLRYPDALIQGVVHRLRVVDRDATENVTYPRAAILKAWLIRNHRIPITEMLDQTNTSPGYLLGRLFAVLEKTQRDSLGDLNVTIRDRYYASASATPRSVFPRLQRTYQHHLGNLSPGQKTNRERLVEEITDKLTPEVSYPAHLNLKDQALFALGYYHQRKDLFTKTDKDPES